MSPYPQFFKSEINFAWGLCDYKRVRTSLSAIQTDSTGVAIQQPASKKKKEIAKENFVVTATTLGIYLHSSGTTDSRTHKDITQIGYSFLLLHYRLLIY